MLRKVIREKFKKLRFKKNRFDFGRRIEKKIAVVGGGPVGLTVCHLLHQNGISFDVFDKNESNLDSDGNMINSKFRPPAAHYINTRSMEIVNSISGLRNDLDEVLENLEDFKYYRFTRRIGDSEFRVDSQYDRHVKSGLGFYTTQFPIHLSQNKFSYVLEKSLRKKLKEENNLDSKIFYNTEILGFNQNSKMVKLEAETEIETEYEMLIAADGFHSDLRTQTQIKMTGEQNIQTFLNVCFESKKLVRALKRYKLNAMLHFIYNSDVIGCLVNHSYKDGIFVLQLPVTPEIENLDSLLDPKNKDMVLDLLGPMIRESVEGDLKILNKGIWNLSSQIADRYHEGKLVLVGDSAHSIPPAGGWG